MLSELQTENLRRLKDREQELKELKKTMEVMKVRQRSILSTKLAPKQVAYVHSDLWYTSIDLYFSTLTHRTRQIECSKTAKRS